MDAITVRQAAQAAQGRIIAGSPDAAFTGVCTDSRKFRQGDLFVALHGEVVDAHKFIPQVAKEGGTFFLVSDPESVQGLTDVNAILVDDTLKGLQLLAGWYLDHIGVRRIAVTGSVGKTSTRDMVYYILSEKYKTGKPIANYNSDVGVPLTIFGFDSSMQMCVLEEGMEHAGEIHRLVEFTHPDAAIITNVGITHLENLGTRENIYKAKMEITDEFGPDNTLIINEDNDMLDRSKIHGNYRVITVGSGSDADYQVTDVEDHGENGVSFRLKTGGEERTIELSVPGAHNAINAGLAIAACQLFGVTLDQAVTGLSKLQLTGKRLKFRESHGIKVLDDSYNAAPASVESGIDTLVHTDGKRHVVILGDMNELGSEETALHEEVGRYAAEKGIDLVIGCGSPHKAQAIARAAKEQGVESYAFETKEELYPHLPELLKTGDVILIKASMTRHFWEISDRIIER